MLTIETKETKISDELKRKIEMIGRFTNTTPLITNGSVLNIKGTNVAYVKPHTVMIKERLYFFFEECDEVFIDNLYHKIKIKDLENFIKSNS